mmetsp:Transcript_586/g.1315  ORF Transcript_586/g.1315 Transcript_586/m.1315 type:complete len:280 (-) Transcript_586:659-1498(-)
MIVISARKLRHRQPDRDLLVFSPNDFITNFVVVAISVHGLHAALPGSVELLAEDIPDIILEPFAVHQVLVAIGLRWQMSEVIYSVGTRSQKVVYIGVVGCDKVVQRAHHDFIAQRSFLRFFALGALILIPVLVISVALQVLLAPVLVVLQLERKIVVTVPSNRARAPFLLRMEPWSFFSVPRSSLSNLLLGCVHKQIIRHRLPVSVHTRLHFGRLRAMEKILQLPIKRRGRLLQPLVLRHGMPVIRERRRVLAVSIRNISARFRCACLSSQTLHFHLQI